MGLPTAFLLAKGGYRVKGYDIDTDKIQLLQNQILPFEEKDLETLFHEASKNFSASDILEPSDVFIITVPTPLSDDKSCEMSYINSAIQKVKHVLRDGNLVVLESTVSPGTTKNKKCSSYIIFIKKSYYFLYTILNIRTGDLPIMIFINNIISIIPVTMKPFLNINSNCEILFFIQSSYPLFTHLLPFYKFSFLFKIHFLCEYLFDTFICNLSLHLSTNIFVAFSLKTKQT